MAKSRVRNTWLVSAEKNSLVTMFEQALSLDSSKDDILIVAPETKDWAGCPVVSCKQAASLLGQEKQLVVIDLYTELCVDAIAIAAGLVVGGGHLVFCLADDNQSSSNLSSLFSKRLLRFLSMEPVQHISLSQFQKQLAAMCEPLTATHDFVLTTNQQQVIKTVEDLTSDSAQASLVVIADRGRGKSTSIGLAAAELMKNQDISILVTAPSYKSSSVAFEHACAVLNINKLKQARLEYRKSVCQFVAPDELLLQQPQADLVLIDEAAAIPLPMLLQIVQHYPKTVFVSTVHGYEGTGRGFFIRFFKALDKSVPGWQKIEMKQPVRWSSDDLLEPWLFKLLCLDAEIEDDVGDIKLDEIKIIKIKQQELSANEKTLSSLFALLVMAHYRTRPSDLQRLLDDGLEIRVAIVRNKMIAAMVSLDEGSFEAELASSVYRGERRPPGHLLAQSLSYHCGVEYAACHRLHRIMRIVVHPLLQGQGIGSRLVENLLESCLQRQIDIIGASFGYTDELASFWQAQGFQLVRLGFSREQSSGERAGLFVQALTEQGESIVATAQHRFSQHLPQLKKTLLSDVNVTVDTESVLSSRLMSDDDRQDIQSFVTTDRSYELCIGGVNKWLLLHQQEWQPLDIQQKAIIEAIVEKNSGWKQVVSHLSLQGKKQAQQLFKQAVSSLWEKHGSD